MAITSTVATGLKSACSVCGTKLDFVESDLKVNTGDDKLPGILGPCQYVICPTCGNVIIVRSQKGGTILPGTEYKY